jgi:hypothetical protein
MRNEPPDTLDRLIDQAVRAYSQAEPLSGLEERILNRIKTAKPKPGHRSGLFALAAAGLLFCLCVTLLMSRHNASTSLPTTIAIEKPNRPPAALVANLTAPHPDRAPPARRVRVHSRLPKRSQFPSPDRATPEERALARFVQNDPDGALKLVASLRAIDAPIEIQPMEIKPLQFESLFNQE